MRIALDGWKAHIKFSAAHAIAGHPKCGRLHGHTYAIHVVVHGDTGDDSMVFDFGVVKRALRAIAERLDHRFIVPARAVVASGANLEVRIGAKAYRLPRADAAVVEVEASSAEHLAQFIAARLLAAVAFPPSVHEVEVGVDEGPGQGAWVSVRVPPRAQRERGSARRPSRAR